MANLDEYRPKDTSQGYAWIKIRTNLLDEPRFMRLSDAAATVYLKLYLLAGKADAGGLVNAGDNAASIEDLAWLLRKSETDLQKSLDELARSNLVELHDDQVTVCRFASEQGPAMKNKREEWALRQAKKRALAKGEYWPENTADADAKPEAELKPEADLNPDPEERKEEESSLDLNKIQTQSKRVTRPSRESHDGVTRDKATNERDDDFGTQILNLWREKTGKDYKPGEKFKSMADKWESMGGTLGHVIQAIDETKETALTPLFLALPVMRAIEGDPAIQAEKKAAKWRELWNKEHPGERNEN